MKFSIFILSAAMLTGCGAKSKDEQEKKAGGALTEAQLAEVQVEEIGDVHDQVIEGIAEDAVAGSALSLTDQANRMAKIEREKICAVQDSNTTKVELNVERIGTMPIRGLFRQGKIEGTFTHKDTRIWTAAGESPLPCHETDHHVVVGFDNLEGVKLDVTFDRMRQLNRSVFNVRTQVQTERSNNISAKGLISAEFLSVEKDEEKSIHVITRSVGIQAERTRVVSGSGIDEISEFKNIKTIDEKPILVRVERDSSSLEWISKTIESGKIRSENSARGYALELAYENLKFNKDKPCTAISGKVTGSRFTLGENTPSETFSISIENGEATLIKSNGDEVTFVPSACADSDALDL
jgi:hypothetical protein